uniref:OCEL domain-containing protein n=1 Tax=Panagrolaimus sp. JU765 TaxID=591449 RepID=A0AC34RI82_9BILA
MISRRDPHQALGNSDLQTGTGNGVSSSSVTNFTISNVLTLQNSPSQQAVSIKLTDDCFESLQRAARENHEVLVHIDKKGLTIEIKTSSSSIKFDCFVQRVSGSVFRVLQRSHNSYNDIANIAMRAQVKPTEKTFQSSRSKAEALSKHLEKESSKCRTQMLQAPVKANDKKFNFTNISKVMGKSSTQSPKNGSSFSSVASSSPVQSNTRIASPMSGASNNSKIPSLKERVIHYIICGKFNNPDEIVDHIISEGLPSNIIADSARRKIREIICEVAEEYRNPPKLVLLPKFHQQVDLNWPFFTPEERSKAQNALAETTLEAGNNFAPLRASTRGPLVAPKAKSKKVSTPPAMTNSTTTSPEIASDGSISMTPSPAEHPQTSSNDHRPVSPASKRKNDDTKSDKADMSEDVPPTKKHRSDAKDYSGANKERRKKESNLSSESSKKTADKPEIKKSDSNKKEKTETEKLATFVNEKHSSESSSSSSSKITSEEKKKIKKHGDEKRESSKSKEKREKSGSAEKLNRSSSKSTLDLEFLSNQPTSSSNKPQTSVDLPSKPVEKDSSKPKKDSSSTQKSVESSSKHEASSEIRKKERVKTESEKIEKSQKLESEKSREKKEKKEREKKEKEKRNEEESNLQKSEKKSKDEEKMKKPDKTSTNTAVQKPPESKKPDKQSETKAEEKHAMPAPSDLPKVKTEKVEKEKKIEAAPKIKNDATKSEKPSKETTKEKSEKTKESAKKIMADLKTMTIRDLLKMMSEPVQPSKNYEEKYPPIRNVTDANTYKDHEIKYYEDYQKAYKYLGTVERDLGTFVERLNNANTTTERESIEDKIRNYATQCMQDSSYINQRRIVANMTSAIEVLRNRLSVFYEQNPQFQ